eukprot:TRINITY_DN10680_c0_g1_i1.p1 TRINITY_DN10680_c0_g1~~TRINITY_DN10680_c0_g1_i1.p1  ORF type:complete len:480 (+),score=70.20 TRINITY_DN10680_c0_g1_i1:54-1442(+)
MGDDQKSDQDSFSHHDGFFEFLQLAEVQEFVNPLNFLSPANSNHDNRMMHADADVVMFEPRSTVSAPWQIPSNNNSSSNCVSSQSLPSTPPQNNNNHGTPPQRSQRKLKSACEGCSKDRKKCEGATEEMPMCYRCLGKGIPCVFAEAKPPGPKPKGMNVDRASSSPVNNTNYSGIKRARSGDHNSEYPDSRSVYSDQNNSNNEHREVVRLLQTHQFLRNDLNTQSAMRNETYYMHCIDNAIAFWTCCAGYRLSITKSEFVQGMMAYQMLNPEEKHNYGLEEEDLEKLFWLTGLDRPDLDFLGPPSFLKHQVGLVFLWLGPARVQNYVCAFTAVRRIYDLVNSNIAIRSRFKGFFSRSAACSELRRNPFPRPDDCVYRLNEGRLTLISEQECGLPKDRAEVYMRSLVKTSYPPYVFEQGNPILSVAHLPDDDFVHELVFTAKLAPSAASSSAPRQCGHYVTHE